MINLNAVGSNCYGLLGSYPNYAGGINYVGTNYTGISSISGINFVAINYTGISSVSGTTSAVTNVYVTSTLCQLSPLEESFQPSQSFMYSVPTAIQLEEVKSARHLIDEFAQLGENWDGYGGSPISDQARDNARHLIDVIETAPFGMPTPEVSPQPSGTISFEWETRYAEVYLEIGNTLYSGFIKTDAEQPLFLQGHAASVDHQLVAVMQNAIAGPSAYSTPTITVIRTEPQWHDRVAA